MATSKQANTDGNIFDGADPPHPTQIGVREEILLSGFKSRGWKVNLLSSNEQHRHSVIQVSNGERTYKLNIFAFPNLAYAHRGVNEKRIQISREYEEHRKEFELSNTGDERCLLLGFYTRDQKTVICAWDAGAYKNHKNPTSCYVRVQALADAMRSGFGQSVDSKERLVCCFQPDLLPFYIENMRELHDRIVVQKNFIETSAGSEMADKEGKFEFNLDIINSPANSVPTELPRNLIFYGAPGTGKSFRLNTKVTKLFGAEQLYERVTFHPDYTYGQFVGTYRPVPVYREVSVSLLAADKATEVGKHEPIIDYVFVPGPFLRLLVRALKNPNHNFVLVIEELNRANAPAVFGEVFQLLDRDDSGEGTFSVVMPTEAQDYLRTKGLEPSIKLPANLYLWATMNSADQGVMPLDAAFKRRWTFEYVPLNADEGQTADWVIHLDFLNGSIGWNAFRAAINGHLTKRGIPEDRLIGPFFMRKDEVENSQAFKNKLLLYLRDDVVRHNPEILFKGTSLSYGALVKACDQKEQIFAEEIDFGEIRSGS